MMYSIGEVEKITGIKSHILRYWESVIPGFAPEKDVSGRRLYSQSEIEKIFRLKYLIYEKKFTIEGAREQLIRDAEKVQENLDAIVEIRKMRKILLDLFDYVKGKSDGKIL